MKRNLTTYFLAAAVILALGAIIYLSSNSGGANPGILAVAGETNAVEIKPTDPVHGSPDAPITVVEYASMTCPHCAYFQTDIIPELEREFIEPGIVKLVFRDFPLDGGARMASALARCQTGEAYFAFIDLLFRNQAQWWIALFQGENPQVTQETVENSLVEVGRMAGMGRDQVLACVNNPDNLALVDANWEEAQTRYGVNSTPTFLINGQVYRGIGTYEALRAIIEPLTN